MASGHELKGVLRYLHIKIAGIQILEFFLGVHLARAYVHIVTPFLLKNVTVPMYRIVAIILILYVVVFFRENMRIYVYKSDKAVAATGFLIGFMGIVSANSSALQYYKGKNPTPLVDVVKSISGVIDEDLNDE